MAQRQLTLTDERRKKRAIYAQKSRDRLDLFAKMTGNCFPGRDRDGVTVDSASLLSLRMTVKKWFVSITFRKEDGRKLKGDWTEVEALAKKGRIPRRPVRINTHIIRGVRACKDIREGYERELSDTDELLKPLHAHNIEAARKCGSITNEEIDTIIAELQRVDGLLQRKQVAVKRYIARGRLAKTIELFQKAKDQKGAPVARACASFTALRDRLGTWRDREVAHMAELNRQRECSLRVARDEWVFGRLAQFSINLEEVAEYEIFDRHKLEVLDTVERMIAQKAKKDSMLRYIRANRHLFRTKSRERKGAEEVIDMTENGQLPKGKSRKDIQTGHLSQLYRCISQGKRKEAKAKIESLRVFVRSNKPGFIFEELSINPDPYLTRKADDGKSILEDMALGIKSYGAEEFPESQEHFAAAAGKLLRYMRPVVRHDESQDRISHPEDGQQGPDNPHNRQGGEGRRG